MHVGCLKNASANMFSCLALMATATASAAGLPQWRADHHMHLGSVDLCERVGDCLTSHDPPAVFGSDAVAALDKANIDRGVVFSSGYLYGLASLNLEPEAVARWTRRENGFTAAEVANFPDRLIGFLSVDPLQPSAIDELRHWRGSRELVGLKLHLTASAVDVRSVTDRRLLVDVIREAAAQGCQSLFTSAAAASMRRMPRRSSARFCRQRPRHGCRSRTPAAACRCSPTITAAC
jgi:uncharacterized protein